MAVERSDRHWQVSIELVSAQTLVGERDVESLLEALEAYGLSPVATLLHPQQLDDTYLGDGIGLTLGIATTSAASALAGVQAALGETLPGLDLEFLDLVEVEILEESVAKRRRNEPNYPELLGVGELAELLEVSRQRASELAGQSSFPAPLARLKAGPVWDKRSITGFLENWHRSPGRPRLTRTVPDLSAVVELLADSDVSQAEAYRRARDSGRFRAAEEAAGALMEVAEGLSEALKPDVKPAVSSQEAIESSQK